MTTIELLRQKMNGKPVFTVPSKAVFNFDSGFKHKKLCDGATFTTGNACVYSCSFCYVDSMQNKQKAWFEKQGVQYPADTGHFGVVIRTKDAIERARIQLTSYPAQWRKEKRVIYASPKVDVAGNMELVRETVEICKVILELTNWDIRLLSKSNLLPFVARGFPADDTGSKQRIIYGVSTGTLDDKLAKAFEEGTPLVSKRLESLHWLQDNGFRTFGMICPSLPQEDYFAFSQKIADAIRVDKCEHVWAEIINLRGESFDRTIAALLAGEFSEEAHRLLIASQDKNAWEQYARRTFEAHTNSIPPNKLRFLQYVNKQTRPWWQERKGQGAVLL